MADLIDTIFAYLLGFVGAVFIPFALWDRWMLERHKR